LVVGFESRDNEEKIAETKRYLKSIEKQLGGIYITTHPFGLSGEVPGQGSNKNWMINQTVAALTKRGLDFSKIFVTTLDADFIIHPNFLAGALHKYLSTPEPERDRRSYTGVFLYHNNYWQAPTPMRLIASGTAFWQMAEMVGSDKYINYSSLSITLKSLIEIGLWIPNKVNDDSGFFWKAYFHYRGNYKVIPHFLPISADAVLDVSLFKTFQNQYLQLKRWAYGVEHLPYIVREYFKRTDIDFWDKTDKLIFVIWANLKWGTLALFITFGGILIPYINPDYRESVLSINLPIISSWILTAAFFGLFATIYVHEKTAPPRPKNWGVITRAWSYIQWLLVPVVLVTISTLPAIDAQTSLMFGMSFLSIFQKFLKFYEISDKIVFYAISTSLILVLFQGIFIAIQFSKLPLSVPLFFSIPWGDAQLAATSQILVLPALSLLFTLTNIIFAWYLHDSQKNLKRMLAVTNIVIVFMFLITAVGIISIFT